VDGYGGYIVQTFVTLLAVSVIAFVILYGARRMGLGRPHGPLELVGQLPLDARRSIYLVKVGTQVLVVGVGDGGMTKLAELPFGDLPPEPPREEAPFAAVLARALGRRPDRKPDGPKGGVEGPPT
jgi:flagellar protein FliO/FliZ